MNNTLRREEILNTLKNTDKAVSASTLAKTLNVSRQVIVGDVALLRASGVNIISTPRGYILDNEIKDYIIKKIVCKHDKYDIEDELNIIVDEGASIEDVIIEHSVYGELIGKLHLSSRRDILDFCEKIKNQKISPLSNLTDGIHTHTIKCKDEKAFNNIINTLKEKNYIFDDFSK